MNVQQQYVVMQNVMNSYPMFMRIAVLDMTGTQRSAIHRYRTLPMAQGTSDRTIFRAILSRGEYIGPVRRSPEGYPIITVGMPVESTPGKAVGVIVADINLIDFSAQIKDLNVGQSGYAFVVDSNNRLVAHPISEVLRSDKTPPETQVAQLAPTDRPSDTIEFVDEAGQEFVGAFSAIPRMNWRAFVQQPKKEAYYAAQEMRSEVSRFLMGILAFTVIAGLLVTRRLVMPLKRLEEAMEKVGEGQFDTPVHVISNDEIGTLADKFLWMKDSLKDKTARLLEAQAELQRWNSELEIRVQDRTRALQEAQGKLIAQEKLAALGQMASVVGHELRNPLAVMNNSVYYIRTKIGQADPKIEKHLGIITSEIDKANSIIRDILDFSRNRELRAVRQKVDDFLREILERKPMPERIQFSTDLALNGSEAMIDVDEMRQVLFNLIDNACQAMGEGGTLKHSTAKVADDVIEISLKDSGSGIPEEHLEQIFTPFFTTKSQGTGLGLAVVKKVIDRHKGRISVTSKANEGTTFLIRLPVAPPPTPEELQAAEADDEPMVELPPENKGETGTENGGKASILPL